MSASSLTRNTPLFVVKHPIIAKPNSSEREYFGSGEGLISGEGSTTLKRSLEYLKVLADGRRQDVLLREARRKHQARDNAQLGYAKLEQSRIF
jgi:hypothetical protein